MTTTREDVRRELAAILSRASADVPDELELTALAADSIQLVELVVELQQRTGARLVQADLRAVRTVADLLAAVARRV